MKTLITFWALAVTFVGGCLLWRNRLRYKRKSWFWTLGKSLSETALLFLTAALLPALLIVWLVLWITKPIKKPWVKTLVGVLSGLVFSLCSSFMLELLVVLGIFAIDLKTGDGKGGFLHCWEQAKAEEATA
jgi:lysylphosphatidylglycerol synthetase-like protein (DUF2156 family)